jgi:hypothetical protein
LLDSIPMDSIPMDNPFIYYPFINGSPFHDHHFIDGLSFYKPMVAIKWWSWSKENQLVIPSSKPGRPVARLHRCLVLSLGVHPQWWMLIRVPNKGQGKCCRIEEFHVPSGYLT